MNAKEYINQSIDSTLELMLEGYHQHKLSEITEKEIDRLWDRFCTDTEDWQHMEYDGFKEAITNLLKGKKWKNGR